jgi:hypothetical protein
MNDQNIGCFKLIDGFGEKGFCHGQMVFSFTAEPTPTVCFHMIGQIKQRNNRYKFSCLLSKWIEFLFKGWKRFCLYGISNVKESAHITVLFLVWGNQEGNRALSIFI